MTSTGTSEVCGKHVTVLAAHFMPEVGYQEVELACAFRRLGARVSVVASTCVSPGSRKIVLERYSAGRSEHRGICIERIPPILEIGPNVVCRGIDRILHGLNPDACVLIGAGKLFGVGAFASYTRAKRIAVFQENSEDGRSRRKNTLRGRLKNSASTVLKRRVYARAVHAADRVVFNVPETCAILSHWLGPATEADLRRKGCRLRLGFDPATFYFDAASRETMRRRLCIGDNAFTIGTCTRATREKGIERIVDAVARIRASGHNVIYALAGVFDDEYGRELRAWIEKSHAKYVRLLPALAHDEMRQFFCALDIGVWPQAAITIQQAMGTGLPIVLKSVQSVSHLLEEGVTGWYLSKEENWSDGLSRAVIELGSMRDVERVAARRTSETRNLEYLSYDAIAEEMVAGLLR